MPDYYLKVSRPDERYCDGCPRFEYMRYGLQNYCKELQSYLYKDALTPPNCPLMSERDVLAKYMWGDDK